MEPTPATQSSTNGQDEKYASQSEKIEKQKKKALKEVHEELRKLSYEERASLLKSFHDSVVERAKQLRVENKIAKYHADTVERQVAQEVGAAWHDCMWVQTYMGDIPVLVTETIQRMKTGPKWEKDKP